MKRHARAMSVREPQRVAVGSARHSAEAVESGRHFRRDRTLIARSLRARVKNAHARHASVLTGRARRKRRGSSANGRSSRSARESDRHFVDGATMHVGRGLHSVDVRMKRARKGPSSASRRYGAAVKDGRHPVVDSRPAVVAEIVRSAGSLRTVSLAGRVSADLRIAVDRGLHSANGLSLLPAKAAANGHFAADLPLAANRVVRASVGPRHAADRAHRLAASRISAHVPTAESAESERAADPGVLIVVHHREKVALQRVQGDRNARHSVASATIGHRHVGHDGKAGSEGGVVQAVRLPAIASERSRVDSARTRDLVSIAKFRKGKTLVRRNLWIALRRDLRES